MPEAEKQTRWKALRSEVRAHQASGWADDFLQALTK
jgi:trehalose-6-phosphate synthase